MAWTAPRTWVTSEIVTASIGNAHWRDNLDMAAGAGKPAVAVARAAAQSIATGSTFVNISFDTEVYDTDTMFAATSTDVTVKTAGLWLITAQAGFASNTVGVRYAGIILNGTTIRKHNMNALAAGVPNAINVSTTRRLAVSDVIRLAVVQNSGGALNTGTIEEERCALEMTWLGA